MRTVFVLSSIALVSFGFAQKHPLLSAGPMISYAEMTEVAIWVQTTQPARVQIAYREPGGSATTSKPVAATEEGDHIALIKISGLPFGKVFEYDLLIDGQPVKRDYPMTFKTQPHWRWTTGNNPPEFTFAFGSCAYINDTPFDRPGRPYGGGYEIFGSIASKKPDFFIWLGDNDYYREPDWLTEAGMRNRMRTGRSLAEMQPMLASMANYAIWDDHDFGPNDSDRSFRLKDQALEVFTDYFPAVQYGTREAPGVFSRFEWIDVEFFMLDDRYYRAPNTYPSGPDKVMFDKKQIQWLKDSLANSRASFKVICNGNQMINENRFECFSQFPEEREELFKWIVDARIDGVVFLSGDRHASELLKRRWSGAHYDFFEYTSSPLCSSVASQRDPEPYRVEGTYVDKERNFGAIKVSGPRGARILTMLCYDKDGKELWKREISQKDLQAP